MVSELLLEEHGEDDGVGAGERPEDKLNMYCIKFNVTL